MTAIYIRVDHAHIVLELG